MNKINNGEITKEEALSQIKEHYETQVHIDADLLAFKAQQQQKKRFVKKYLIAL